MAVTGKTPAGSPCGQRCLENGEDANDANTFALKGEVDDIDQGWAWIALLASWTGMVFLGSCASSVGLTYISHLETFEKDPSLTACVGALFSGLTFCFGPVAGWICQKLGRRVCVMCGGVLVTLSLAISSQAYNFWLVFVLHGIVAGTGLGLASTPCLSNVGCYFVKRRSLASGICVAGYPIGLILSPPLFQFLGDYYGWRGCLLIFAGLQFNWFAIGMAMKPSSLERREEMIMVTNPEQAVAKNSSEEETHLFRRLSGHGNKRNVLRNRSFTFLVMACIMSNFSINMVYVHFPRFVSLRGGSPGDVQALFLILGLSGFMSKLLTGLATGDIKNGQSLDKTCLLIGAYSVAGLSLLILPPLAREQSYRLLCSSLLGFYYNIEPPLYVPLIMETVGLANLNLAVGLIHFGVGVGFFTGPPAGGLVYFLASVSAMCMTLFRKTQFHKSDGPILSSSEKLGNPKTTDQTL